MAEREGTTASSTLSIITTHTHDLRSLRLTLPDLNAPCFFTFVHYPFLVHSSLTRKSIQNFPIQKREGFGGGVRSEGEGEEGAVDEACVGAFACSRGGS